MKRYLTDAPVAQLDRATGFEPVGRGFESLRAHQILAVRLVYTLHDNNVILFQYAVLHSPVSA